MKIGFYGLSHLGICYSNAYSFKGFQVFAVDKNILLVEDLKKNIFPIYEVGLNNNKKNKNIKYSNDIKNLNHADFIYYSRDVITDKKNNSNYELIRKEILELDKKIKKKIPFIILSQIYPGFIKSLKIKREIYYQVETLIFGRAIERARKPERIIIGKNNKKDINPNLLKVLKKFTKNLIITNYETAELTKITINLFLISSIMTANSLALYCEKIGANWKLIIKSLQLDKRIGMHAYVNPSPGLSGGNLERDLKNANSLFKPNDLYKTWIKLDLLAKNWTLNLIKKNIKKKSKILIVGTVYKKGTKSLKNSFSEYILKKLFKDYKIYLYEEDIILSKNFKNVKNIYSIKINTKTFFDAIIYVNDWYHPNKFFLNFFKTKTIVVDPYGYFYNHKLINKFKYFSLGVSN
jgi:UDPglucose 6-dehydrogenase